MDKFDFLMWLIPTVIYLVCFILITVTRNKETYKYRAIIQDKEDMLCRFAEDLHKANDKLQKLDELEEYFFMRENPEVYFIKNSAFKENMTTGDTYKAYVEFCKAYNIHILSPTEFRQFLSEHFNQPIANLEYRKGNSRYYYFNNPTQKGDD